MFLDARHVKLSTKPFTLQICLFQDRKILKLNSGEKVFSKMDFFFKNPVLWHSAFWRIELHSDSRYFTLFRANHKLYRYQRLTVGVKAAQGELNMALQPLFAYILQAYLIHDDLIVAAETDAEHHCAIYAVMQVITYASVTLNPNKQVYFRNLRDRILVSSCWLCSSTSRSSTIDRRRNWLVLFSISFQTFQDTPAN